ncbi:MAG TPA: transposase [Ktedonobacterales bacterium]|nr:transposase [Ktedonobacterales bacterium]
MAGPAPTPDEAHAYLGVALGVITRAATSDGEFRNPATGPQHAPIKQGRARSHRCRAKLQQTGTKSATRLLRKRSSKEKRGAKDVTHWVAKALLSTAKGPGRGRARDDLKHRRSRVHGAKRQRSVLHRWACCQLRAFIAYTAARAGVSVSYVNPADTSQTCSHCGQCAQAHRRTPARFLCVACGVSAHAALTAAEHLRRAARSCSPTSQPLAG